MISSLKSRGALKIKLSQVNWTLIIRISDSKLEYFRLSFNLIALSPTQLYFSHSSVLFTVLVSGTKKRELSWSLATYWRKNALLLVGARSANWLQNWKNWGIILSRSPFLKLNELFLSLSFSLTIHSFLIQKNEEPKCISKKHDSHSYPNKNDLNSPVHKLDCT